MANLREKQPDVALFFHDNDGEIAKALRGAMETLGLTVKSVEDFPVGRIELGNIGELIEYSWRVVLICTEDFLSDKSVLKFASFASLHHSIKNCLCKVIPVKYTQKLPVHIGAIHGCKGSKTPDEQAEQILKSVVDAKKQYEQREIAINECRTKATLVLDCAVQLLVEQHDFDEKLRQLHQTMRDAVDENIQNDQHQNNPVLETGCSCRRGEFWKKEIGQEKYWAINHPEPFQNIEKFREDHANKHTADVHRLYEPNGYLKLATVFLFKRPTKHLSAISDLDQDAHLQLLHRCRVFNIPGANRASIKTVRDVRHKLAHISVEMTAAECEKYLASVVEDVKSGCFDLLCYENWKLLVKTVEEVGLAKITATVAQGQQVQANDFDAALQGIENLSMGQDGVDGASA